MSGKKDIEIRKPVHAIQIDRRPLTLLQQKLMNIVLWDFYQQPDHDVPDNIGFSMPMKRIAQLLGYKNRTDKVVMSHLHRIAKQELRWGWNAKNGEYMGFAFFMSYVSFADGEMKYHIPYPVRQMLLDRDIYDLISVNMTSMFRSKYALALYEVCHRHLGIGHTGRRSVEAIKELLGVDSKVKFKDFHDIKRHIIEPALKEVNDLSDIHVKAEYLTSGRKVVAIDFHVKERVKIRKAKAPEIEKRPQGMSSKEAQKIAGEQAQVREIIDVINEMPGPDRRELEARYLEAVRDNPLLMKTFREQGLTPFMIQAKFDWFEEELREYR